SRSCARFSPTTATPASASSESSSIDTYFVATTTVTLSPTSSRTRSYRSRSASADVGNDSLTAGASVVAAVREEAVDVARSADVETAHALAACCSQRALGGCPEIELPVAHDVLAERLLERARDLVPHLVATRTDARADRRGEPVRPDRADTGGDDPREEAAPA